MCYTQNAASRSTASDVSHGPCIQKVQLHYTQDETLMSRLKAPKTTHTERGTTSLSLRVTPQPHQAVCALLTGILQSTCTSRFLCYTNGCYSPKISDMDTPLFTIKNSIITTVEFHTAWIVMLVRRFLLRAYANPITMPSANSCGKSLGLK